MQRTLFAAAALASLAPLTAAQHVTYSDRSALGIDDVAITPDGRYAVYRDGASATGTHVVDLETGLKVLFHQSASTAGSGPCVDAVEVTNERAISIGSRVVVIDLTTPAPTVLSETDCGFRPRDVEIGLDGRFAVVRGGSGPRGGAHVFDLATGDEVFFKALGVQDWFLTGNDLVAATSDHGVILGFDPTFGTTEIIVLELDPMASGGPRVVLETNITNSLAGRPMDVAISPDGLHAAVRSEDDLALVRLDGSNTTIVRRSRPWPTTTSAFGETAFDTVVMTDDLVATITIALSATEDGYLSLQSLTGTDWTANLDGAPRDLVLTPNGRKLLVHTGEALYEFDLTALPAGGGMLSPNNAVPTIATASGLLAGFDSIVCTNEVALCMYPDGLRTSVRAYDLTTDASPEQFFADRLSGRPIDIELSPDGFWGIVVTQQNHGIMDLRTPSMALTEPILASTNGWAWSDGAAIHPDHAVACNVFLPNSQTGWLDTIDLVSRETLDCRGFANGTGGFGDLYSVGSTRVAENDLTLHARSMPAGQNGVFVFGDGNFATIQSGVRLCVSGQSVRFGLQITDGGGSVSTPVDLTTGELGALAVGPGSTWYAQFFHRDPGSASGIASTNSIALLFE